MDYNFSYKDKVAKCNSFRVMRQFITIFTQKGRQAAILDRMELKSPQFNSTLVGASLWEVS